MAKRGALKLEHNLGADDRRCMRIKLGGAQSRNRDFRGRKPLKIGQF